MEKTRKQKLIEMIGQELEELEGLLIETPEGMSEAEYQELIEKAGKLRTFLKFAKE